uniref:Uncharacterized protein n=1 Tax=Cucumis melo TaxID=3656 RepID=A0A9I9EB43_CUCME
MDAAHSKVSTNDVILNRSCRDMGVGVSYVRVAQHHWPNKPPISEKNECGFIFGRMRGDDVLRKNHLSDKQPLLSQKSAWWLSLFVILGREGKKFEEEAQNYKRIRIYYPQQYYIDCMALATRKDILELIFPMFDPRLTRKPLFTCTWVCHHSLEEENLAKVVKLKLGEKRLSYATRSVKITSKDIEVGNQDHAKCCGVDNQLGLLDQEKLKKKVNVGAKASKVIFRLEVRFWSKTQFLGIVQGGSSTRMVLHTKEVGVPKGMSCMQRATRTVCLRHVKRSATRPLTP